MMDGAGLGSSTAGALGCGAGSALAGFAWIAADRWASSAADFATADLGSPATGRDGFGNGAGATRFATCGVVEAGEREPFLSTASGGGARTGP